MLLKTACSMTLVLLAMNMLSTSFRIQTAKAQTTPNLIPVPFHYGQKSCGPGSLSMVLDYYGANIPQDEIANSARTTREGYGPGTVEDDLRRAAQFSNLSTSVGSSTSYSVVAGEPAITGYTLRGLGYAAFEARNVGLATLKSFIDQGKPLIVSTWWNSSHNEGHYRVAIGYDDNYIYFNDPSYGGGPDYPISISQFLDLWSWDSEWALYVTPWLVNFSAPGSVEPNVPFQLNATVTYPQPLPNALDLYPAYQCKATIALPVGLSLAKGESQTKTWGFLKAGDSYNISWALVTNSSIGNIGITAEGIISGSVDAIYPGPRSDALYPGYSYSDRIGASGNFPINIKVSHEITVQDVAFKNIVSQGCGLKLNISLLNRGQCAETFNLTVYCSTMVGREGVSISTNQTLTGIVENVTISSSMLLDITFTWNTTEFAYGNYVITVCTSTVTGAVCTFNSSYDTPITVTIPGDVDGNFKVDISDLVFLAQAYGSKPSDPNWNSNADIDGNGVVGLSDLFALAKNYGQHYP